MGISPNVVLVHALRASCGRSALGGVYVPFLATIFLTASQQTTCAGKLVITQAASRLAPALDRKLEIAVMHML